MWMANIHTLPWPARTLRFGNLFEKEVMENGFHPIEI
jgi:hypothetical protein